MRLTEPSTRGAKVRVNTILGITYACILAALGIGLIGHRWMLALGLLFALATICCFIALVAVYFGIDWRSLQIRSRGGRT